MKFVHLSFTLLLASLLTGVKGQCETEIEKLNACEFTLTVDEQQACLTCVENFPDYSTANSCEDLESTLCSYISGCETSCGSCSDEIESYGDCLVNFASDCDLNCGSGSSGGSGGTCAVLGSFTVFFLGLASLLWV